MYNYKLVRHYAKNKYFSLSKCHSKCHSKHNYNRLNHRIMNHITSTYNRLYTYNYSIIV